MYVYDNIVKVLLESGVSDVDVVIDLLIFYFTKVNKVDILYNGVILLQCITATNDNICPK